MNDDDDLLPDDFDDIADDPEVRIQIENIQRGYVKAEKFDDFYYSELVDMAQYLTNGSEVIINNEAWRQKTRSYRLNKKKPKGMVYNNDD